MSSTAAAARGVHKAYGPLTVLAGIDLEIATGSVTALLGPSGGGKTTLLRALAGFDRVDAGRIELAGVLVDGPRTFVPARRRRVGYVPQEGALFTHLSVAGNIGFGVPRARRAQRVRELVELIGLDELQDRRPDELSGGQQQRVALARALAIEPSIVLLDEPFSALDPGLRAQVRQDVLGLLRTTGTTALLVTHDQEEALSVADQVAVLDGGRIAQVGTPEQLYAKPVSQQLARFLGSGTLLAGTRTADRVDCALGLLPASESGTARQSGLVLVRSEQFVVNSSRGEPGSSGRVTARSFYGHDAIIDVELDDSLRTSVRARCPGTAPVPIGANVTVHVDSPVVFLPDGPVDASISAGPASRPELA